MHATRLLSEAYGHWTADRIPQTAAALAYYTVFSIAPLLLIAIGIAGLVLGEDNARAQVLSQATALVGERSAGAIERMMGDGDEAQRRGVLSTILGFATLLVGAVGVLAQLKSALNTVWNVETGTLSWSQMANRYLANFALVFATGSRSPSRAPGLGLLLVAARAVRSGVHLRVREPPWVASKRSCRGCARRSGQRHHPAIVGCPLDGVGQELRDAPPTNRHRSHTTLG